MGIMKLKAFLIIKKPYSRLNEQYGKGSVIQTQGHFTLIIFIVSLLLFEMSWNIQWFIVERIKYIAVYHRSVIIIAL